MPSRQTGTSEPGTEDLPQDLSAADKKARELVSVEVVHVNGWPYRGAHMPHGTPLDVPRYVLEGNPDFIKAR